ncbi:MAG TPA: DUF2283 domain-containing protein, partial [Chloroflexota bacterium]
HNVAYLRLKERRPDDADWRVETVNVSDDLNVDLAPDGTVYGIELLNANEQLGQVAEVVIAAGSNEERRQAVSLK